VLDVLWKMPSRWGSRGYCGVPPPHRLKRVGDEGLEIGGKFIFNLGRCSSKGTVEGLSPLGMRMVWTSVKTDFSGHVP
jgi:hypothetical protein